MSRDAELRELALDYFRLVDANRIDEMYDLWSDDLVYRRAGTAPIEGKAALIAFFEGPRGVDTIKHDMTILAVEGDCVVLEGRAQAQLTNGGSFDRRIAEIFWYEGDKIVRRHGYADVAL